VSIRLEGGALRFIEKRVEPFNRGRQRAATRHTQSYCRRRVGYHDSVCGRSRTERHEYGHALQHNASQGRYSGNGQKGAMGEGFGDYWAFSVKSGGTYGPVSVRY